MPTLRLVLLVLVAFGLPTLTLAQTPAEIDPETGLPVGWKEYSTQSDECNGDIMTVHWIVDDTGTTGSSDEPQVKHIRCELVPTPQGEALLHVASYRCGMTHVVLTTNRFNTDDPWGEVVAYYPCWAEPASGDITEPIYPVSSSGDLCVDHGFYELLAITEHTVPREDAYALMMPEGCWPNAVG